jgi:hypothetical protein
MGAAACTEPTLKSAIDLAPFEVRPVNSPVADGIYCIAAVSWRADGEPISAVNGDADECARYRWDVERRIAVVEELEGRDGEAPERMESAMIPLGDGVFMTQTGEACDADALCDIALALIEGDAIGGISMIRSRHELAKRFPAVILSEESEEDPASYIKSGDRTAILAYLKDAARLGLVRSGETGNFALPMMVRVETPGQETVFTLLKRSDVAALKRRAEALARGAPRGIAAEGVQWNLFLFSIWR